MTTNKNRSARPPRRRADTIRIPWEVARRVSDGHPWIFSEALKGRSLTDGSRARPFDIVDPEGQFVARALADPGNSPVLRVFSSKPGAAFDARYLRHRIGQCLEWRRQMGHGPQAGFRLLAGDAEGVPAVTADCFAEYMVVCFYSELATVYQEDLLAALFEAARPRGIYLQRRFAPPSSGASRAGAELVLGSAAPSEVVMLEGRCRFGVDVSAPGSPGLFLDMRHGRDLVARIAGGARVLNCFSYTGGFSVAAAVHGALEVVSIDSAARAHGRARRNFELNQLDLSAGRHEFITGDTFATLARLADRKRLFDLIVLDPPTFSKGAKGQTFAALKDYAELVRAAVEVLAPGGTLLACCNAARLPAADLDRAVGRGAARAGARLVVTGQLGLPADFPVLPAFTEGAYLKIISARRLA